MNLKRLRNIHAGMPIYAASSASLVVTGSTIAPPLRPRSHTVSTRMAGAIRGGCRTGTADVDSIADCAPRKDAVIAMIGHQIRRPRSLIIQVKYGTFAEIDRYIRGLVQSER